MRQERRSKIKNKINTHIYRANEELLEQLATCKQSNTSNKKEK